MQSSDHLKSRDSGPSAPCALWPVDLKLIHLDWNPEATLIYFQGQYLTICELDYNILQGEIQKVPKAKAAVDIGEFCLVEDLTSACWFRGRVQNQKDDLFDVFLIDHGNVLSVDVARISSCSNDLFILPPKIVCGFLANVLLLQSCPHSVVDKFFSSLIGRNVTGYIQAHLPHKVLLLEAPDINSDLVRHGFGRHVDTDTFLFLVEMVTEVPLKQNVQPVPDLLIEKPRGQEFCFKPSSLQAYEDILSFCGPRLSCGTRAKVRVTAAVNPGLFYCQMTSMEIDLWEMSKKLTADREYRTEERDRKPPENLGLLCSVKGKDGGWYRGLVQFLPVNSQVRVLFIDYGFFESVKVENVHRLPPDFCSRPIMAFPCSLSCLNDQDNQLKTQQSSFLKAGLLGRVLDVEISSFDEEQHLYSVTVFGADESQGKESESIQTPPSKKAESVCEAEEVSPQGSYSYLKTVMGEALRKTLEVEEVQVGSAFMGYVEHAQNPHHFWIRTQKRNDEFEEMMTKMTDHFSQVKLDEDVLLNPELGALCCAVYEEDMHFYRGVVTNTLEHGAEVLFIDFGNIEKVPHMLIKNIPETLASKSAFAFCCTLVNAFPFDDVWTSASSDLFRHAVSNKALLVHVVHIKKNKFVVDLFEMGRDNSRSITELLISSKQAEYIPIEPVGQNSTEATEETRRPQCNATADLSGNTEQWRDCEEDESSCMNEMENAPTSFKALSMKPGWEVAVCCSYISSPSDFWCQPVDKVPALEELMDKVQQYYSAHTVPLRSGDSCCVAKSARDGKWYRAFITEKQGGQVTVRLVDYGGSIRVSERHLQAVMPEYVYLEGQAFRCSLYNLIEPADPKNCGGWSPEVCSWLKTFGLKSTGGLKCTVVSQLNVKNKGLCYVVDLHNSQTQQSVTSTLIQQGLARAATLSTKLHSTVFPESFVYSSFELRPGREEQVYVTHVSSQCEVYCHLDRNTEIIEELEQKISEESENMMRASTRAVVSKLCLAKYLDGRWYRSVAHPIQSPLHLRVFFVDYGNANISEKTSVMFLHRDSADLLYTPMQAVRCRLDSVSTEELYADVTEWLNGAVLNKLVRAVIRGKNEDGSFNVELFDGDVNINEKVKELIVGLSYKPKPAVRFNVSSMKTKTHHRVNTTWRSPPAGPSAKSPISNACRDTKLRHRVHVRTQNTKVTRPDVGREPVEPREKPQSEQPQHSGEAEILQLSRLPDKNLSAGFRAKCFVSHIDSVSSFFLQLSEDEPAILKMGDELNSSVFRDPLTTTTSVRINDVVLAEFEEDGALYRAVVKNYEGSSCCKVEFVDYGNSAVVGKEKIYSMPKEYLSQPRFGISCSVLDASTYRNDASFTDAVMEKPLMVQFVRQYGGHWEVTVEILDEQVRLSTAAAESSPLPDNVDESPSGTEERVTSCDQSNPREDVSEDEISKSERTTSAVEGENPTPKPSPVTLSIKPRATACRCRRRAPTRNKSESKKSQSKTRTSCVTAVTHGGEAFLPPTIQASVPENGVIQSVQSNGRFYARLTRTRDLLTALESHIANSLYKCKTVAREDIKQGLRCLVQTDDKWRRAVVHLVNEEKLSVVLVDHGVTKEIPRGSVRQQCGDLANIPNLAVLCKMNSLGFSEGEDAHKLWCDTLKSVIGKEVQLVFVRYSAADRLWLVEVVMSGLFLVRQYGASLQENEDKSSSPAETQDEGSEEGPSCDADPPQPLAFAPIDAGKAYSGFAAAVTTPFEFCVVLEDLLLVMNKVSVVLDDLPEQMPPLPEEQLVPGSCCLLKSDSRNKWCRAEIVHVDATVVLNLVDYGHHECVPYDDCSKLKKLPVDLTSLPKVTYPCILRGVKPVGADGQWSDEAVVFFQQCLYQKDLQIFFRECVSNSRWTVDVLAEGVHVAKELVDAGHGRRSPWKAPPRGPDSGGERGQHEEGSDEVEAIGEPEEKMSLGSVSGPSQCVLM